MSQIVVVKPELIRRALAITADLKTALGKFTLPEGAFPAEYTDALSAQSDLEALLRSVELPPEVSYSIGPVLDPETAEATSWVVFRRVGDSWGLYGDPFPTIEEAVANMPGLAQPEPEPELPAWVQPTGAQDAYQIGAQVTHNGANWVSTVAANVWEPGVFGWQEVE